MGPSTQARGVLPTKGKRRRSIRAQASCRGRGPRGGQRVSGSGSNERPRQRQLPLQRKRLRRRKKSRARRESQAGPSPWVRGLRAAEATGLVPSW